MKESAIMGWSNQPDGAAALPVLVMLDTGYCFLRVTHCVDRGSDSQLCFCGSKYAARGTRKKPLSFTERVLLRESGLPDTLFRPLEAP